LQIFPFQTMLSLVHWVYCPEKLTNQHVTQ
jgi:hypothetical protein